ncbi:enoyl-CoA hydratase-related protein [Nonomuraea sp. NPDC050202]|jgi:enoyl-CoA hydratase/carnithine racemase|uniref:enoyl-CoA hydratase-related protein n=1 Tax=unclassified Nonomuraea TaxID=2593643 RepID=UPI0033EF4F3D
MPVLDRQDDVFILDIGDTENRLHPDWIASVNALLDEVEKGDGPRSLVTVAQGKFFSNGLDLDWVLANTGQAEEYVSDVQRLLARMLTFPMVTVAALQGHAFAAGAMFSLAHDFRVMRRDRGYWCLPEAQIDLPFTPGMSALVRARLTAQVAHEAMVTARRYGGYDAVAAEIVDASADATTIRAAAIDMARDQTAKAGPTLGTIKARMYAPVVEALREKVTLPI